MFAVPRWPSIPRPENPPDTEKAMPDDGTDEKLRVHEWRMEQLTKLGFDYVEALELVSAEADWHQADDLIGKGLSTKEVLAVLA